MNVSGFYYAMSYSLSCCCGTGCIEWWSALQLLLHLYFRECLNDISCLYVVAVDE